MTLLATMMLSVPPPSFVLMTSFMPLASFAQPQRRRPLVPKAPDIHPLLSGKHCDVLVRHVEVSGITQQRDFA